MKGLRWGLLSRIRSFPKNEVKKKEIEGKKLKKENSPKVPDGGKGLKKKNSRRK